MFDCSSPDDTSDDENEFYEVQDEIILIPKQINNQCDRVSMLGMLLKKFLGVTCSSNVESVKEYKGIIITYIFLLC